MFDLGDSGAKTLTLNAQDLLQFSDETNDLRVLGNGGGDTVDLGGSGVAAGQETIEGVTFDVFTFTGTEARLLAETGDVLVV